VADWREREVVNETLARDINEIEDANHEHIGDGATNRYVCECSDASCMATISLTQDEYEQVRAHGARFVIALDHENPELDLLVAEHEGFAVVRKLPGFPARLARASDPRGGSRQRDAS
jgi:hypothetical protein